MNPNTPRNLPLPTFEGLGENKRAKCFLERDWNYHKLVLEIAETGAGAAATDAALLALIPELALKVDNGKPRRMFSAAELNAMNSRHNKAGNTCYSLVSNGAASGSRKIWLTIWFYAPWLEDIDPDAAAALCWDARKLKKLTLEAQFAAATNPGVSVPAISGWFVADKSERSSQGLVQVVEKTQLTLSGTKQDVPNFSMDGFFQSLSITNPAAGAFTKVQFSIENEMVYEKSDTEMATDLVLSEKTRQTGRFDLFLDPTLDVRRAVGLSKDTSIKLHVECAAAMASTDCLIETLQPLVQ